MAWDHGRRFFSALYASINMTHADALILIIVNMVEPVVCGVLLSRILFAEKNIQGSEARVHRAVGATCLLIMLLAAGAWLSGGRANFLNWWLAESSAVVVFTSVLSIRLVAWEHWRTFQSTRQMLLFIGAALVLSAVAVGSRYSLQRGNDFAGFHILLALPILMVASFLLRRAFTVMLVVFFWGVSFACAHGASAGPMWPVHAAVLAVSLPVLIILALLEKNRDAMRDAVSHELEGPLLSMLLGSEFLLRAQTGDQWVKRLLLAMDSAGKQMLRYITDLLEAEQIVSGGIKKHVVSIKTDLRALITEAVESSACVLNAKSQRLELRLSDVLPAIDVDYARMVQAFRHVLTCAGKAAAGGETIHIDAEAFGRFVKITVSDSGAGSDEGLPRTFESFEGAGRVKSLGFSVAKAIIEAQGGRLWLGGDQGKRTSVVFTVPIYRLKPAQRRA